MGDASSERGAPVCGSVWPVKMGVGRAWPQRRGAEVVL